MNLVAFYQQTPVGKHQEIVIAGERLFFDGEEYVIRGDGELRMVRSLKAVEQRLEQIETNVMV